MRNKFRIALLSMAAVGLVGCADKLSDDLTKGQDDGITDGFVAFQISNIGSETRAAAERGNVNGDYNAGESDGSEYAIKDEQGANVVFFFDTNGGFLNKSYLQKMSLEETGTDIEHSEKAGEKYYTARIRKSKVTTTGNADQICQYCVLILNAKPSSIESLSTTNLDDFMNEIDNTDLGQYGDYLTMSNTVYSDNTGKLQGPKGIKPENICDTWEEAQQNKITVHVERVVAKFQVTYNKTGDNAGTIFNSGSDNLITLTGDQIKMTTNSSTGALEDAPATLAVRIKGWNVNATETATYWMKHLADNNKNVTGTYPNATLPTGKQAFGNWDFEFGADKFGWNDQSRLRSYWAVDPHYDDGDNPPTTKDSYPEQYRKATDVVSGADYTTEGADQNKVKDACVLNYISYNQIGSPEKNYRYAPENTFGEYGWYGTNVNTGNDKETYQFLGHDYKRTGTHILVAAELLMDDELTNTGESSTVGDKYCYQGVYWTTDVAGNDLSVLIKYMVSNLCDYYGSALFMDDRGQTPFDLSSEDLIISKYFELVDATIKGGDGRKMLSIKDGITFYKKGVDEEGKETYTLVNNDLKKAIEEVGTVKHFKEGKMYYPIYIEHMVATADDGDTHKWNIGSYGVVRNHWYKVNVSAINNPGVPVDDPDQPIIPNDDPDEPAYAAFEIVIIPWHVINQNVGF